MKYKVARFVLAIVTLGLCQGPMALPARAETGMDLYNNCGNAFMAGFLNRSACHTYVYGIGMYLAGRGSACFNGATDQQMILVVQTYMRDHPEGLNQRSDMVVARALVEAFPC